MLALLGLSSGIAAHAEGPSGGAPEESTVCDCGPLSSTPVHVSPGLKFDWFNKAIASPLAKPFARALNALIDSPTSNIDSSIGWSAEGHSSSPTNAIAQHGVSFNKSLISSVKSLTVVANTSLHSEDSATSRTGSVLNTNSEWQQFSGGNGELAMPFVNTSTSNANADHSFGGHAPTFGYPSRCSSETGALLAGVGPFWFPNAASSHMQLACSRWWRSRIDAGGCKPDAASNFGFGDVDGDSIARLRVRDEPSDAEQPSTDVREHPQHNISRICRRDGACAVAYGWGCLRGGVSFGTIGSAASSSRVPAPPTVVEEADSLDSSENVQSTSSSTA